MKLTVQPDFCKPAPLPPPLPGKEGWGGTYGC